MPTPEQLEAIRDAKLELREIKRVRRTAGANAPLLLALKTQALAAKGVLAEAKREAGIISPQRPTKRTVEELDIERRDSRKRTRPSYFS